jgi:D-psicose/D-tagatose/L-ribulose 3-epimerase
VTVESSRKGLKFWQIFWREKMNKIGLHFNYWNGTGAEKDIYTALDLTAKTGVDVFEYGIGVILNMSKSERKVFKNAIEDKGLVPSINGGVSTDLDMAANHPALRRRSIDAYKQAVEIIAEMESIVWSGVNYSAWLRMPEGTVLDYNQKQRIWDVALESVREFALTLQEYKVTCCFEIVNRYEHFVLNTAGEGVKFTNQVGNPYAKLLLDTYHMNIEEDNIADAISFAMKNGQLGHIHLGESNRRLPGIGKSNMNWPDIFDAIKQSGYSGYLTLEPLVLMGTPLARKVNVWRDLISDKSLPSMIEDVKKSVEFVRSHL